MIKQQCIVMLLGSKNGPLLANNNTFFNETICVLVQISVSFVPNVIKSLMQVMAWHLLDHMT